MSSLHVLAGGPRRLLAGATALVALWPSAARANSMGGYGALAAFLLLLGASELLGLVALIAGRFALRRVPPRAGWVWVLGIVGLASLAAGFFCVAAVPGDPTFLTAGAAGLLIGVADLVTAGQIAQRRKEGFS